MNGEEYIPLLPIARDRWQMDALCAQIGPAEFFPEMGGSARTARSVCRRCPVQAECLEAGMSEKYGVWGGLSELERKTLRAERNRGEVA